MSPLRTLFALALLCGSSLPASPRTPSADELAGMTLDASGRLADLRPLARGDRRDNVALFGHRPTLVVVGSQVEWRKTKTKDYVKRIKELDKLAKSWTRAGAEVLFVAPVARIFDAGGDPPEELALIKKAKPKYMICAHVAMAGPAAPASEAVLERLLQTEYSQELEFRWALIETLGVVAASGPDVFAADVAERRAALEVPEWADRAATKKAFAALNEWRLGEAEALLARLESDSKASEQAESIASLRARLERSEEHYRRVFCAPQAERRYLPEAIAELERLGSRYFAEGSTAARLSVEVAEARSTSEFEQAAAQQAQYLELLTAHEAMEAEVERVYLEAMGKTRGYDEQKYNQAILDVYPETLARLRSYVDGHPDSPYRAELARLLMYAQEDLQDARELARGER